MSSQRTLQRLSWLDRSSIVIASLLSALGFGVIASWWFQLDSLFQQYASTAAINVGDGVCVLFLGLLLLALELRWTAAAWLAWVPAILSALSLAGDVFHVDLQLHVFDRIGADPSSRMSIPFAACSLATALVLAWSAFPGGARARLFAEAVSGSIAAAAGFSTLLGYAAGLPAIYRWGTATATSPITAVALLLIGICLLLRAWREATKIEGGPPAWSPMPAVIGCLTLTIILWIGLREREQAYVNAKAQASLDAPANSINPEFALAAGVGITLLLGLSVHLARRARSGQRAAELSNIQLLAENEERRRIEARLKVSDERLRLALDSTQIGIFEWNVNAGHVYYSPGLWAMLGYEQGRMAPAVEAWQSLIHPDDLSVYRRRIDSQLANLASFIEPEYRVRAHNGEWRWVYTRSKTVAVNHDGTPARIIGTVQDITARREAEQALRESQAEARKLSLVASKTDNPVLIASPSGAIEWVNESFTRVMEYSLEEVVGKSPADFMDGPETDPVTVERIRAAMAQGQGISTDVVNYSKSGRKYHLRLQIQPIRDETDRLQNFIAIETDITARVDTEKTLRRAKAEADDASRAKSEFLASMSHEIRTPMNGVIGMTSLLLETPLNPEQLDFINTIRTSGEALLTIINDILDFSKIESGKLELEHTPFELAVCIEEALDLFALQASAKKLEMVYHISPTVPAWIMGDITRLRQVIVNLVNNAVKFTPRGGIVIEVDRLPDASGTGSQFMLEFTVRDSGIGIPAERRDRLFKAFSQVDSSTTRKYGGTGLGLAISQRLSILMGGGIRVESTEGQGSSFIFTVAAETAPQPAALPLAAGLEALRGGIVLCVEEHPMTQRRIRTLLEPLGALCYFAPTSHAAATLATTLPSPPTLLIIVGDEAGSRPPFAPLQLNAPRLLMLPFGQTAPEIPSDSHPFASIFKPFKTASFLHTVGLLFSSPTAEVVSSNTASIFSPRLAMEIPLNVLLAEDNTVNQKVALRFLERLGYRADTVSNGLEALTTLEARHYHLVLMDLQMPEMDGLEASRQIRRRLSTDRQPKIIALTANAMQGDRQRCLDAGMDDYISKPVKLHEIEAAIRRLFAKTETSASVAIRN